MNRSRVAGAAVLFVIAASAVFADDAPPPPPPVQGCSGKGELGYVMSRGNSDTDSANAKIELADTLGDWKHSLHLEGLYGRSNAITSAERWAAIAQSDLKITPRAFGFVALHFLQDEFSGFQYQASASAGVGYKFIDTVSDKLSAQVGGGYRRLRPELLTIDASGAVIARTPSRIDRQPYRYRGFRFCAHFQCQHQTHRQIPARVRCG